MSWTRNTKIIGLIVVLLISVNLNATELQNFNYQETNLATTIILNFSAPIRPQVRFLDTENCWIFDFIGVTCSSSIEILYKPRGPIKFVRREQVHDSPPIQRISCYIRRGAGMKCLFEKNTVYLQFKYDGRKTGKNVKNSVRCTPQPLLTPFVGKTEILLELKNVSFPQLVSELCRQAGINLNFRDPLPPKVSVSQTFGSAREALEVILQKAGYVLTHETEGLFVTKKENPLLKIVGDNIIAPQDFSGLSIKDCLKRVLPPEQFYLIENIPENILSLTASESSTNISSRAWLEKFLQCHGIDEKVFFKTKRG